MTENSQSPNQKSTANGFNFPRRSLAIWTALVSSVTIFFSNMPFKCSQVELVFDYPKVTVNIELRLNLEGVRYCEVTPEQKHPVEEGKIEE